MLIIAGILIFARPRKWPLTILEMDISSIRGHVARIGYTKLESPRNQVARGVAVIQTRPVRQSDHKKLKQVEIRMLEAIAL